MSEPRKIVLVLGNGFDLDLGLKTRYQDFWESDFCPRKYPAPLIAHLNGKWPENLDKVKWYDLENELLKYYYITQDSNTYTDCITEEEKSFLKGFSAYEHACGLYNDKLDLVVSLINKGVLLYDGNILGHVDEYLKEDALKSPIWRDHKAFQLIKEGLCNYLNTIHPSRDASSSIAFQVLAYLDEAARNNNYVNIYTFNYTRVLLNGSAPRFATVHYVHGKCEDGKIIIGTRDDQNLNEDYDFLQKSFDPSFDPPALVEDLREADEVVFFGHSIGENDRQYFKAFFKQQANDNIVKRKEITIFTLNNDSEVQIRRALQRMTDWNLSTLYGHNTIRIIKTGNLEEDKDKLYDFLVTHGKDEIVTREFIGRLLQKNAKG